MNKHFFTSLLAMDVYNRGYNAGVGGLPENGQIGTASATINSSILLDSNGLRVDISQGFYAIAYDWNGQTVISYRGTDPSDGANAVKDIINGWSSFTRIGTDSQFGLAKQFFNRVTNNADFPAGTAVGPGNVITTGHSLGGALAGFVGVRGITETELFDPIPYAIVTWQTVITDALLATVSTLNLDLATVMQTAGLKCTNTPCAANDDECLRGRVAA